MDPKALKKLADACRKAGIKSYKCPEFEFTLSDEGPISNYKRKKQDKPAKDVKTDNRPIESDSLSEEALLFWSTGATSFGEDQDENH